jgi:hypothetical protein
VKIVRAVQVQSREKIEGCDIQKLKLQVTAFRFDQQVKKLQSVLSGQALPEAAEVVRAVFIFPDNELAHPIPPLKCVDAYRPRLFFSESTESS